MKLPHGNLARSALSVAWKGVLVRINTLPARFKGTALESLLPAVRRTEEATQMLSRLWQGCSVPPPMLNGMERPLGATGCRPACLAIATDAPAGHSLSGLFSWCCVAI